MILYCIDFVICISAFSWVCHFVVKNWSELHICDFVNLKEGCRVWDKHDLCAVCKVVSLGKCSWETTLRKPGLTLFETRLAGIDVFGSLSYSLHDFEQSTWFVNNKDFIETSFWQNRICDHFDLNSSVSRVILCGSCQHLCQVSWTGKVSTSSSWQMWFVS